jgi:NAD/NADP transhydrogenase alpha subunit
MMRDITVEDKKYKIRMGYGAYQRLSSLFVFLRATGYDVAVEMNAGEASESMTPADNKTGEGVAVEALKSERLLSREEAEQIGMLSSLNTGVDIVDLLSSESKLNEKINEAKVRILEIVVRDANGNPLTKDYLEYDLSASAGETLLAAVIETYNVVKSEVTDKERKKKS